MEKGTKKTAAQRLSNLEDTLVGTLQALGAVDNEQTVIKEGLSLIGSKLDAVVTLLRSGKELSDANIANLMVEGRANKMAEGTQELVQKGVLTTGETVDENSFVIVREVMDDGSVINPRMQFTVESAKPHLRDKIMGAKILDKITIQEGKAKLEVLEIYSIQQPKAPEAPQAQA